MITGMKASIYRNSLFIYSGIFVLAFLCLLFPFRIESQPGGTYPTLFGVGMAKAYTEIKSGFEIPAVFIEFGLMFIAASLMVFTEKRVFKILSLIALFFVAAYMFLLYVIITFHFNLFGPIKTVTAGTGYFLFMLVELFFVAFTIYLFVKTFKSSLARKTDLDLLDEF